MANGGRRRDGLARIAVKKRKKAARVKLAAFLSGVFYRRNLRKEFCLWDSSLRSHLNHANPESEVCNRARGASAFVVQISTRGLKFSQICLFISSCVRQFAFYSRRFALRRARLPLLPAFPRNPLSARGFRRSQKSLKYSRAGMCWTAILPFIFPFRRRFRIPRSWLSPTSSAARSPRVCSRRRCCARWASSTCAACCCTARRAAERR